LGSGMPNHYVGDLLHTIGISGLSRVRTELLQLAVVASPAPHPVQMHRQLAGHRHFRNLSSTSHRQMKELAAPLRLAAHRHLRRFHQQKPEQHVPLLADVSQSAPIAAGFFRRNQAYVAGNLFATRKTSRRSDSVSATGRSLGPTLIVTLFLNLPVIVEETNHFQKVSDAPQFPVS